MIGMTHGQRGSPRRCALARSGGARSRNYNGAATGQRPRPATQQRILMKSPHRQRSFFCKNSPRWLAHSGGAGYQQKMLKGLWKSRLQAIQVLDRTLIMRKAHILRQQTTFYDEDPPFFARRSS